MAETIVSIWPVPAGHTSEFGRTASPAPKPYVSLFDLIGAGLLDPGTTLYPRRPEFAHRTATVLADGRLDVDGKVYDWPSGAARAITGKNVNGWWFFLVDPDSTRSLSSLLPEYADQTSADIEEAVVDDENDPGDVDGREGKYGPLAAHLAGLPSEQWSVTLTFREISEMVGGLPDSAYRRRQFWANNSKVQARAWRSVGWHVAEGGVDVPAQTITFARGQVGGSRARRLGEE